MTLPHNKHGHKMCVGQAQENKKAWHGTTWYKAHGGHDMTQYKHEYAWTFHFQLAISKW